MARIRSLHPGQTTDEEFVALSMPARVFCLMLRCFADDQGVFEWKPVALKMKIFPADSVEINELLAELVEHKQVRNFEHSGKQYGAIRNFRKYQRPQKPTAIHPLPDEYRSYVGLSDDDTGEVEDQPDTATGNPPQREEIRGKRVEEGKKENIPSSDSAAARLASKPPDDDLLDIPPDLDRVEYAFRGKVLRLNKTDYAQWKQAFHAIPDLDAELLRIDAGLAGEGKKNGWFPAASAMLNAKHQKLLGERKARPAGGVTPLGVGG